MTRRVFDFAVALVLASLAGCQSDPKPLVQPTEISACNLDSDCGLDTTCDCTQCVTRNKTIHVQMCPQACDGNPCQGKHAVCIEHRCQLVK